MKTINRITLLSACSALLTLGAVAPSQANHHKEKKADIVDTAVKAGQFNTLAAALTAAGLVDTLKGDGPFTVFAPTDDAFAALPEGTVETLLKPENKEKLTAVLTYHVVAGKLKAADVTNMRALKTVQGSKAPITLKDGGAFIANAKIISTDIKASNGIIHVIDAVILPPEKGEMKDNMAATSQPAASKDIVDTAVAAGSFSTLAAALTQAGLIDTLKGEGPFTVFAPTDEAFAKLPKGTVESLLKPENKEKLISILTYHVAPGNLDASKVTNMRTLGTVQGEKVKIKLKNGGAYINDAKIIKTDIATTNGVIHVIDSVILPPEKAAFKSSEATKLIDYAIQRGAPLYNHGNVEACVAVYEVTANALLKYENLAKADRWNLKKALRVSHHSPSDRAWALRHALDGVASSQMKMMKM